MAYREVFGHVLHPHLSALNVLLEREGGRGGGEGRGERGEGRGGRGEERGERGEGRGERGEGRGEANTMQEEEQLQSH